MSSPILPGTSYATTRTSFPYHVRKITTVTIRVREGTKLAATIWMPSAPNGAIFVNSIYASLEDTGRFPAIFEFIPYRKADWTSPRDELRLKYFAGFGYASVRVDIRGTGNSEGLFDDEYSAQEMDDAEDIIEWIHSQPWCDGKVVMFGKSWSGFNGLQMAARQTKHLSGVISAFSTDDRYSDDIHYVGGCMAASEALSWSTQMLLWNARPPTPVFQGGIEFPPTDLAGSETWRQVWKKRLDALVPLDENWIKHQNRDSFWRHGSICEDYSKIKIPVFLLGGFQDLYTDPVFRMMNALKCDKHAVVGPWGHQWPDSASPAPRIGILQTFIRFLDHYMKGIQNGINLEPRMTVYQMHPNAKECASIVPYRAGEWMYVDHVPAYEKERDVRNENHLNSNKEEMVQAQAKAPSRETRITPTTFHITQHTLLATSTQSPSTYSSTTSTTITFSSPVITGTACGNLLGWGNATDPDGALEQNEDDGRGAYWDSDVFTDDVELFGFPSVRLEVSSDTPNALLCVRLCAVDENGTSILLSRGILNLTHRHSHETPTPMVPGQYERIAFTLNGVCCRISRGYRLRLAVSNQYWPIVWPSPVKGNISIRVGHSNGEPHSCLTLPVQTGKCSIRPTVSPPEVAPALPHVVDIRDGTTTRVRTRDEVAGKSTLKIVQDSGRTRYEDGLVCDETCDMIYEIIDNDPMSATATVIRHFEYDYPSIVNTHIHTVSRLTTVPSHSAHATNESTRDETAYVVEHELVITERGQTEFEKKWKYVFPRSLQ